MSRAAGNLKRAARPAQVCMGKTLSVRVVATYKHRYENNTQYPFYTVAVKHETGELIYDTDSLIGGNKSANNKLTSSLL